MISRLIYIGFVIDLVLWGGSTYAAESTSPPIIGPDARGLPRPASPAPQPSLEQQLRNKKLDAKGKRQVPLPDQLQPATQTEELLADGTQEAERKSLSSDAKFRMSIGLAYTQALGGASNFSNWSFEPGTHLTSSWRIGDAKPTSSLWLGLRLSSLTGHVQTESSFARFAWLYVGPLVAWDYSFSGDLKEAAAAAWQLRLVAGFAAQSRQTDPEFPGDSERLATKGLALDGTGLYGEASLRIPLADHLEWEIRLGAQHGALTALGYSSLGLSLWTD
ncbi:MAG: hypothetical protein NTX25_09750 [Proteobacteria bacterium]|nr:hypothetical protein [Pseudomonadota bacterium]